MTTPLRIDIVSDVMCPWCIIGYRQLAQALEATGVGHEIHWHPFELNPDMPPEGQNTREHIIEKYGSTPEQSAQSRAQMTALGADLDIDFRFTEDMRMHNTFNAHQLLHWADIKGRKHDLKMALFTAHFTDGRDLSDIAVLAAVAGEIGLDAAEAVSVLEDQRFGPAVRQEQNFWIQQGIHGVPAVVFDRQHLVTGAQGVENYMTILKQLTEESVLKMPRSASYDRETALDAAMALFWEKGFHATSLKDLEAALAMKPGSIYAAFTSKQNLYLLALERYFEKSRARFRDQVTRATSPLDAMADHFRVYARLAPNDMSRQACMLTKTLVDTRTTDPAIAAATQGYLIAMQDEFAAAFTAARNAGELADSADPNRLARRFQANITALRLSLHQGMGARDFTQLAEDMALEIEDLRMKIRQFTPAEGDPVNLDPQV